MPAPGPVEKDEERKWEFGEECIRKKHGVKERNIHGGIAKMIQSVIKSKLNNKSTQTKGDVKTLTESAKSSSADFGYAWI